MHRVLTVSLVALLPVAAWAQAAPGEAGERVITRDQFIQRAADMAGRRFDAIDTGHTGTITRAQLRAFRQSHGGPSGSQVQ